MNKLYKLRNKARGNRAIVAASEDRAIKIALFGGHAKKAENLTCEDITDAYSLSHAKNGFDVSMLPEGFMYQVVCGPKSKWMVTFPPAMKVAISKREF